MNNRTQAENPKWPCVMIDLETLGTSPAAVVLEIGVVCFDPVRMEMGPELRREVSMRSPDQQEREVDEETFMWWAGRISDGVMMPGLHDGMTLRNALVELDEFLRRYWDSKGEVWSWGIDFDLGILVDAMRDYQINSPWKYAQQRDARTLCKVLGVEREGEVLHAAVDDARQEAAAVLKAMDAALRPAMTLNVMRDAERYGQMRDIEPAVQVIDLSQVTKGSGGAL